MQCLPAVMVALLGASKWGYWEAGLDFPKGPGIPYPHNKWCNVIQGCIWAWRCVEIKLRTHRRVGENCEGCFMSSEVLKDKFRSTKRKRKLECPGTGNSDCHGRKVAVTRLWVWKTEPSRHVALAKRQGLYTHLTDKDWKISTWGCLGQVCILDRYPELFQDKPSVLQVW